VFILLMALAVLLLWRRRLFTTRWLLWALMLATPFPFVANTLGWVTAEAGRQPWIIYGVLRTAHAGSQNVSSGNVGFTLLGFMGLYALLALFYFALLIKIIGQGPQAEPGTEGAA
jgi:cytochrome d ubiquinol oxidase subunit I